MILSGPESMAKFHTRAAWIWMAIGVFGIGQFVWWGLSHREELMKALTDPIAMSIPVLFFISVYANVVGHWSSQQAAKVEVKQDAA